MDEKACDQGRPSVVLITTVPRSNMQFRKELHIFICIKKADPISRIGFESSDLDQYDELCSGSLVNPLRSEPAGGSAGDSTSVDDGG